jgi:hypothetical protein
MKLDEANSLSHEAWEPVPSPRTDLTKVMPVTQETFNVYRSLYTYNKKPLNAKVENSEEKDDWRTERVTYTAGIRRRDCHRLRSTAEKGSSTYQTVIYFPGSYALTLRKIKFDIAVGVGLDVILRRGRAVICPEYKSTFERGDGFTSDIPDRTSRWRDHVNILAVGGLNSQQPLSEADVVNFLPHVKKLTLMLNDEYDFFYPERSSEEPFCRLLGT